MRRVKKGIKAQWAKPPTPTWAIDALIGDEEQNRRKKKKKGTEREPLVSQKLGGGGN